MSGLWDVGCLWENYYRCGVDKHTRASSGSGMKVEVRAVGLKAIREKRGLTQRKLAHDLGISQNYIPAIEAGARKAGPKLKEAMLKYFGVRFEDLFEVVLRNGAGADFRR